MCSFSNSTKPTHETRPFSVTLHFTADAKIADTWQFANMPLISSSIYSHTQKSYYYFYAKKLSVPASYLLENIFAGEVSSYPEKPALGVPLYTNQCGRKVKTVMVLTAQCWRWVFPTTLRCRDINKSIREYAGDVFCLPAPREKELRNNLRVNMNMWIPTILLIHFHLIFLIWVLMYPTEPLAVNFKIK